MPFEQNLRPCIGKKTAPAFNINHSAHRCHLTTDPGGCLFDGRIIEPNRGAGKFQSHVPFLLYWPVPRVGTRASGGS